MGYSFYGSLGEVRRNGARSEEICMFSCDQTRDAHYELQVAKSECQDNLASGDDCCGNEGKHSYKYRASRPSEKHSDDQTKAETRFEKVSGVDDVM